MSLFYATFSPQERYRWGGAAAICPRQLAAETARPEGASLFPHLVSRFETMHVLVGSMGGSTAYFLEGLESNCRYPRPRETMAI